MATQKICDGCGKAEDGRFERALLSVGGQEKPDEYDVCTSCLARMTPTLWTRKPSPKPREKRQA